MEYTISTLMENGFSEQEARIYITCLELGTAPASRIANKLGENKVTIYSTLKNMIQKGIVASLVKKSTAYYSAITPDLLFKKKELIMQKLKESLPILSALGYKNHSRLDIKLYEGVEGVKTAMMEIINTEMGDKDFLCMTGTGDVLPELEQWLKEVFLPYRSNISTQSRVLLSSQKEDHYFQYSSSQHTCKIINNKNLIFENEIILYGHNKIGIINYKNEDTGAITITSTSLFQTISTLFEIIWLH